MNQQSKSTFVNVLAWIFIVLAGFMTLISILQNIMISYMFSAEEMNKAFEGAQAQEQIPFFFRFIFSNIRIFFSSFLIVSGITFISAIGLLKRKNWARIVFIAIMGLGICWNILSLIFQSLMLASMSEVACGPMDSQFSTMMIVIKIFTFIFAVGLSYLFGWIIYKLGSSNIKSEFVSPLIVKADDEAGKPDLLSNKRLLILIACSVALTISIGIYFFSTGNIEDSLKITFPTDPNVRTQKDVNTDEYNWMIRNVVKPYKSKHIDSSECDIQIEKFLDNVCRLYSNHDVSVDLEALISTGKVLLDNGCNDPFFLLWYATILNRHNDYDDAGKLISENWVAVEKAGYPCINIFFAQLSSSEIDLETIGNQAVFDFWSKTLMDSLSNALKNGEFKENEMQIVYHLLWRCHLGEDISRKDFLNRLGSMDKVDPWLKNMVESDLELRMAWTARGKGWASEVTEEGWKGFKEHSKPAYAALLKAWELHPEYPEAAARLIEISKTGLAGKNESDELWFSRAVAAQIDYKEAYESYLLASLPRWGGSYYKMLSFGEKCLETKRFDTDVPVYYLFALRAEASDIENYCWFKAFRKPGIRKKLDSLYQGLLEEPTRHKERDKILTQQALTLIWMGDYEKAKAMLEKIREPVDLKKGFCGNTLSRWEESRETINAELRAFTGEYGEILKKAESLSVQGEFDKSKDLFVEGMEKYKDDKEVYAYLRDRIALQMAGVRSKEIPLNSPALHVVITKKCLDAIEFLLTNGAEVNSTDHFNNTPLHMACLGGNTEAFKLLLESGANVNLQNKKGETPLSIVCFENKKEFAFSLIEHGADVNIPDNMNNTPLRLAVYAKASEIAEYLINHDADIHKQSNDGWNALHTALYYGAPEIAKLLISKNIDVNTKNNDGETPLMYAVYSGYPEICKILIDKGADVNAAKNDQWTSLHLAAESGRSDIVLLLLKNGADQNSKLPSGETPLDIAKANKKEGCIEILSKHDT